MKLSRRWWIGVSSSVVLSLAVVAALEASAGAWYLATDVQKYYRCLPYDWYVVTPVSADEEVQRGDLVQFEPPSRVERLAGEFSVIKIAVGLPGDHWRIEKDWLFINGQRWGALHLMESLALERGSLDGDGVIPEGHLYVLGTNPSSYDSRYWGPLGKTHVTGRAYAVL